ncbi:hypothetical protein GCM10022408_29370 [Hymenobacter fastidiosus]|uniref:Transporter n=1 Tax=Hymenobacter fastidiosus TaxID=486264 RepID=A0ABP7SP57_9BACT
MRAQAQSAAPTPARAQAYTLFRPVPRDSLRELRPDRPGFSESPFTVDAGHFQLESDLFRLLNHREPGHRERDFFFNHALLKLGLSQRTDLGVEVDSYSWEKEWTDQQPPERRRGFGDLTLRLKHTLIGEEGKPAALGIIGTLRLPVGHTVGTSAAEYGLIVPFAYDFSKKLNTQLQLRSDLLAEPDGRHFLMLTPSTAIDYEFSPFLSTFAELAGQWDVRQAAWQASLNLGPQLHFGDNLILDCGTHLALTKEASQEYFLGFSFRI